MKRIITTISAILCFASTANAQMVRAQDPETVAAALRGMGYKAKLAKDDTGSPYIESASGGSNFSVFFFECTKGVDCKTIQFFTGYSDRKPTLTKINDWNADKRFARAYLTQEGLPRLEMDLDLDYGGVSSKLFEDNIEFWVALMSLYETHIAG